MTIIVETGTIVTGANSYVSEADLVTYAAVRGVTITGDTEELLIKAMDYTEGLAFKGVKFTDAQDLQWPRANVYVDGYLIATDEIPADLVKALNETAMSIFNDEDPLADVSRVQEKVKVGSLEVTYASGSSSTTLVKKISNAFRKLLVSGLGSSFSVKR